MRPRLEERKHLRELKWNELISRQDAYRFYIKLILEVHAFFYATTGAVLLFYLNQHNNYMEFFLLLPILMGTVIGGFLIYATALQHHNSQIIEDIRFDLKNKYEMGIEDVPDRDLLKRLQQVFGSLFFIVALSLSAVPILRDAKLLTSKPWAPLAALVLFTAAGITIVIFGALKSRSKSRTYLQETEEKRSKLKTLTAA